MFLIKNIIDKKYKKNCNNAFLILIALGIIMYLLADFINLIQNYLPLVLNGSLVSMHDSSMNLFIINFYEIIVDFLLMVFSILVLILYVRKNRYFPELLITFNVINILYFMTDYTIGGIFRSIGYVKVLFGILIATTMLLFVYLWKSQSVKNAFIN